MLNYLFHGAIQHFEEDHCEYLAIWNQYKITDEWRDAVNNTNTSAHHGEYQTLIIISE